MKHPAVRPTGSIPSDKGVEIPANSENVAGEKGNTVSVSNEERDGCLSLCCIEMGVLEEHHGGTHSLEGKHAEQFIIVPLGIDHQEVERLETLLIEERCDRGPVHQGFDDTIL